MRSTILALALLIPGAAFAHGNWRAEHPRRFEVNHRLAYQNARIREGRESGRLTWRQARQLHAEDRSIRWQERRMAAHNGGHISRAEEGLLNHEENRVSRRIYNQKHAR